MSERRRNVAGFVTAQGVMDDYLSMLLHVHKWGEL